MKTFIHANYEQLIIMLPSREVNMRSYRLGESWYRPK